MGDTHCPVCTALPLQANSAFFWALQNSSWSSGPAFPGQRVLGSYLFVLPAGEPGPTPAGGWRRVDLAGEVFIMQNTSKQRSPGVEEAGDPCRAWSCGGSRALRSLKGAGSEACAVFLLLKVLRGSVFVFWGCRCYGEGNAHGVRVTDLAGLPARGWCAVSSPGCCSPGRVFADPGEPRIRGLQRYFELSRAFSGFGC